MGPLLFYLFIFFIYLLVGRSLCIFDIYIVFIFKFTKDNSTKDLFPLSRVPSLKNHENVTHDIIKIQEPYIFAQEIDTMNVKSIISVPMNFLNILILGINSLFEDKLRNKFHNF